MAHELAGLLILSGLGTGTRIVDFAALEVDIVEPIEVELLGEIEVEVLEDTIEVEIQVNTIEVEL